MANNQQTKKRRVAAAQQMERQQRAVAKAERRRRLIVGGIVGFLALALVAPRTAGLLGDDDPEPPPVPTTTVPLELPWASGEQAGASLTGPTPCPATDGSATRTTEFAEAPPLCIEPGTVYDLTFDTAVGSFTVPVDSGIDEDVANLAAVLGWYRTYEQSPVISLTGGLLWIGSPGNPGFTLDPTPPTTPVAERYPIGTVAAIPSTTLRARRHDRRPHRAPGRLRLPRVRHHPRGRRRHRRTGGVTRLPDGRPVGYRRAP